MSNVSPILIREEVARRLRAAKKPGWWKPYEIADDDFVALEAGANDRRNGSPNGSTSG